MRLPGQLILPLHLREIRIGAFHRVVRPADQETGGDIEAAEFEIQTAGRIIREANGTDSIAGQPVESCWWDWSIAKSLAREFGQTSAVSEP